MIKGVIFDLDGVIVSTDKYHYQAWKKMADLENIYFDEKINDRLRGVSRMESLSIILEKANKSYTEKEKVKLAEFKNELYKNSLDNLTEEEILPGITELLDDLQANNIKIAIGSSSKNAKKILHKIRLFDRFDAISDGTNISKSKPDPEVFIIAAEKLNLQPEECAVVEDAHSGIVAAKAANMVAFATGDAKTSQEKDYDFEQIKDVLLKE
jgi:beta-phosphoglucomutase